MVIDVTGEEGIGIDGGLRGLNSLTWARVSSRKDGWDI